VKQERVMIDALKTLFENDVVSEEIRAQIEEAWESKVRENKMAATAELREEFAQKYEHDKATMVDAIDAMLSERLTAEIAEFQEDRAQLAEAKAKFAVAQRENANLLKGFVVEQLQKEIQELHADKKAEIAERKSQELSDAISYQTEVSEKATEVFEALNEIGEINGRPQTFYETAKEAYDHRNNVENLRNTLISKNEEVDPYQSQIDELNNSAIQEVNWENVNQLTSYKEHQEFLLKLLTNKDSFIRKKIIDQNLAYLNNRLTYYLDKLGLPHQVLFQNDLNVEITQLGQDLDFDNLSRGERNRLILGMSFAFRDVWESLYQGVNLLFIDELIDSGMDTAGVENALGVLKKMGRERDKNIYLISHKDELVGRVNNVLKVIKENGFTSYENDIEVVE
jgi:hypothetical protein